jgi:hypothetical protein
MFSKTRDKIVRPVRDAFSLAWTALIVAVIALIAAVARAH